MACCFCPQEPNSLRLETEVSSFRQPWMGKAHLGSGDSSTIWVTVQYSWPQNCFSFLDDPAYLCSSSLVQIGSQRLICFPHFQAPQCHPCIELASLPLTSILLSHSGPLFSFSPPFESMPPHLLQGHLSPQTLASLGVSNFTSLFL